MMRLARIASLLVAFYLLISATTAYAECAWVLWKQMVHPVFPYTAPSVDPSGSVRGLLTYYVVEAHETRKSCEDARAKEDQSLKELEPKDRVGARFLCLPDTLDPRGPKGEGR